MTASGSLQGGPAESSRLVRTQVEGRIVTFAAQLQGDFHALIREGPTPRKQAASDFPYGRSRRARKLLSEHAF